MSSKSVLLREAGNDDVNIRLRAINALGSFIDDEVNHVLECALEDPDWHVALDALQALNARQHKLHSHFVEDYLLRHPRWNIRHESIRSVLLLSDEDKMRIKPILEAMTENECEEIRHAAMKTLSQLAEKDESESAEAESPLALPENLDACEANSRAVALGKLAGRTDEAALRTVRDFALHDSWWGNRGHALTMLMQDTSEETVRVMLESFESKSHWTVRRKALNYLLESDHPDIDRLLNIAARDTTPHIRKFATRVLKARYPNEATEQVPQTEPETLPTNRIEALLQLLHSDDATLAQSACDQLCNLDGSKEDAEPLLDALESGTQEQKRMACYALANFQGEEIDQALAVLSDDGNPCIRAAALYALYGRDSIYHGHALMNRINDPSPQIRACVADNLSRFAKTDTCCCLLSSMLADPCWEVREAAVNALCEYSDRQDVTRRLGALLNTETSWRVRAAIEKALRD